MYQQGKSCIMLWSESRVCQLFYLFYLIDLFSQGGPVGGANFGGGVFGSSIQASGGNFGVASTFGGGNFGFAATLDDAPDGDAPRGEDEEGLTTPDGSGQMRLTSGVRIAVSGDSPTAGLAAPEKVREPPTLTERPNRPVFGAIFPLHHLKYKVLAQ
jgi:hypothetical protein